MPKINTKYDRLVGERTSQRNRSMTKANFEKFAPEVLGLGNLSKDGSLHNGLAAVFDLEGFTRFCNQVDSHLVVPLFTRTFLAWMFTTLREMVIVDREHYDEAPPDESITVYGALPVYAKFLGDGILLLWDTDQLPSAGGIWNVIMVLDDLAESYHAGFYEIERTRFGYMPQRLRLGIARGQIIGFDKGTDYVGSCINLASRLQKLPGLTYAVSSRGLDLSEISDPESYEIKKVNIRGIGDDERIFVRSAEFAALGAEDQEFYS